MIIIFYLNKLNWSYLFFEGGRLLRQAQSLAHRLCFCNYSAMLLRGSEVIISIFKIVYDSILSLYLLILTVNDLISVILLESLRVPILSLSLYPLLLWYFYYHFENQWENLFKQDYYLLYFSFTISVFINCIFFLLF